MTKFELIPYRLYLSQSKTWMHKVKAEVKIFILFLLWASIFVLSYHKLVIIACSLIITSSAIENNQNIFKKHFVYTLGMTVVTMIFSLSLTNNYYNNLRLKQLQFTECIKGDRRPSYTNKQISYLTNKAPKQLLFVIRPASYFFITIYSIKLVMITTSSEILAITIYNTKVINQVFNNELLFVFLLSSHIVNSIIIKLEKIIQVVSLRGNLNLYEQSTRILMLFFLIFKLFFSEIIKESQEISQALYTRNLNQENNNFLKIYTKQTSMDDYLCLFIATTYLTILLLA
uniref:hypothetical protein n=1 Tax=Bangia atropurpurea TaxID=31347 RepID=UPI001FCE1402|nr:hypothetical protein MW410_pgp120 [Bangia atropurpurea]UNJ18260.1 hypothetical protein [Bangia atropurpurea]